MDNLQSYIKFTQRPISLYPSYRPMYKISLIILILAMNCHAKKASILKLHLFSWALKSKSNFKALQDFALFDKKEKVNFFGVELNLNRALNYAVISDLIGYRNGMYVLIDKGIEFSKYLISTEDLFIEEKKQLGSIARLITETKINKLKRYWRNV